MVCNGDCDGNCNHWPRANLGHLDRSVGPRLERAGELEFRMENVQLCAMLMANGVRHSLRHTRVPTHTEGEKGEWRKEKGSETVAAAYENLLHFK